MNLNFKISTHEYPAGEIFDNDPCYGAYIEVDDEATYEWFKSKGYEGSGYTVLALVESLRRTELHDKDQYEMEAEADNTWVYGPKKKPIDCLLSAFAAATATEEGVLKLIENASDEFME